MLGYSRWRKAILSALVILVLNASAVLAAAPGGASPALATLGIEGCAGCAEPTLAIDGGACVDFEGLGLLDEYHVGDSFLDSGALISAEPFQWSGGTWTTAGYARVEDGGLAGGAGLELMVNNINLTFDFGGPLTGLQLRFGEYGGSLNLRINGDHRNVQNMADLHGQTVGGVQVAVASGLGQDQGALHLAGVITDFALGGQELWIDDVCPASACVDLEELVYGTIYGVGASFADSGVTISVEAFQWGDGIWTDEGYARVDNRQMAGGMGLDLNANNANLGFHLPEPWPGLSLLYGHYGGNLNLEINGVFLNLVDLRDIHGQVFGGVRITVSQPAGSPLGKLAFVGRVSSFKIGGQELWIDRICPESCCIDFELPALGTRYAVGDEMPEPCAPLVFRSFQWSDGRWTDEGYAEISAGGLAGGSGQELWVNNINVSASFGAPVGGIHLLFGEYGGNVNVGVNGEFHNVPNLADLDGLVIGGAQVGVINGLGNDQGVLTILGEVSEFTIGGQELAIDHLCPLPLPPPPPVFLPYVVRD